MFFLNPRDLSENLSPWSIRSKDDIYQFWSSLLHCCFCKEHNIVLSKAGFTFFYNWIKSFMGSFLNLHMQIPFHKIFLTIHDKEVPCLKVSFSRQSIQIWMSTKKKDFFEISIDFYVLSGKEKDSFKPGTSLILNKIFRKNFSNKKDALSNRFYTRCAKFWFFVPAWFTCCHLDFCKLCAKVRCKVLKIVTR